MPNKLTGYPEKWDTLLFTILYKKLNKFAITCILCYFLDTEWRDSMPSHRGDYEKHHT